MQQQARITWGSSSAGLAALHRTRRYVQAELVHCRTAMAAVAGILIPSVSAGPMAIEKTVAGTVGFFS